MSWPLNKYTTKSHHPLLTSQTKHVKPSAQGESGQILKKEFPVHHSNVQLYSEQSGVVSRVGYKVTEEGKKVRYLLKTGEALE